MDITKTIAALKLEPGFAEHVGMILVHNGIVRAWSRSDHSPVTSVEVTVDQKKIDSLIREYQSKPGIFRVIVEPQTGRLQKGDDLLFILVAGDVRENVKPVLAELLDRVKAEAVHKTEMET
ncbi:MAG TPA: molybdenum cofactor biosynthesis protein MoaE [Thermodesulfobacteriota bacterium]|nr:molybdenum cofactor biosynthesis protein MoaE [Deltaproteobacteria bacterium]HNU71451.1 molybdenum cofactor biosynthesis protein MoaE [Thermodesulfobacteriota bacterium]